MRERRQAGRSRTGSDQFARVEPHVPLQILIVPPTPLGRSHCPVAPERRDPERGEQTRPEGVVRVAAEVVADVFRTERVEPEVSDRGRAAEVVPVGEEGLDGSGGAGGGRR